MKADFFNKHIKNKRNYKTISEINQLSQCLKEMFAFNFKR